MTTPTKTPWFPRSAPPVRNGRYECAVRLSSLQRGLIILPNLIKWDGTGFLVPFPMVVVQWRGLQCCHQTVTKPCNGCPIWVTTDPAMRKERRGKP